MQEIYDMMRKEVFPRLERATLALEALATSAGQLVALQMDAVTKPQEKPKAEGQ